MVYGMELEASWRVVDAPIIFMCVAAGGWMQGAGTEPCRAGSQDRKAGSLHLLGAALCGRERGRSDAEHGVCGLRSSDGALLLRGTIADAGATAEQGRQYPAIGGEDGPDARPA